MKTGNISSKLEEESTNVTQPLLISHKGANNLRLVGMKTDSCVTDYPYNCSN